MRCISPTPVLTRIAVVFAAPILIIPNMFAQQMATSIGAQSTAQASFQQKLQQITNDQANFVAGIVSKFEADARATGKWDANYSTDMQNALMKLQPANLVAAGNATSDNALLRVLRSDAMIPTPPPC